MKSNLVNYTRFSPNTSGPRTTKLDTATIHCVVGQVTVEQLGEEFSKPERKASSNYGVDRDGRIGLYVLEENRSWCSSSESNDNRAVTIEVACDPTPPYAVTEKAYESLIRLLADICQRNGISQLLWQGNPDLIGHPDLQNMTVHRWFAATACPGDYLYSKMGEIAMRTNALLLIQRQTEEAAAKAADALTAERFREWWLRYRKELQDNDSSAWSELARDWAVSNGLVQGGTPAPDGNPNLMWEDILTREQFITVLYRFAKLYGLTK